MINAGLNVVKDPKHFSKVVCFLQNFIASSNRYYLILQWIGIDTIWKGQREEESERYIPIHRLNLS